MHPYARLVLTRLVGVLALIAMAGCATSRQVLAERSEPEVGRVVLAPPAVDLWVEGAGEVADGDARKELAEAKAALASALDGRGLDASADDADAVLVVREKAVTRTKGRKVAQVATVAGITVGAVAVVAGLFVLAKGGGNLGCGGGHGGGGIHAASPAPSGGGGVHLASPAPKLSGIGGSGGGHAGGGHGGGSHGNGSGVSVNLGGGGGCNGCRARGEAALEEEVLVDGEPEAEPEAPPPFPRIDGPEERGFFDGDAVELFLSLEDARTGEVLWRGSAVDGIDPKDGNAVRRLVDQLLARQAWARGSRADAAVARTP
jgi:hypothetical protein